MAHELTKRDHMFSVREVPWHKLGTVLTDNPATSEEAIKAAKLDWMVTMEKVFSANGTEMREVPGFWATIRKDKEHGDIPLGVVGKRYNPLQNTEAFEFFDPLVRDGIAAYETAGSLREGRKVWVLAKMKGELLVGENDKIDKYVLLSNSHDGSSAVTVKVTPVRVVCNNTLSAALSQKDRLKKNEFSLRHTSSVKEKLEQAQMTLETVNAAYDQLGKVWSQMAEIELPRFERFKFINRVFPDKAESKNDTRLKTLRTEVLQLFEKGAGMDLVSANGTLWGAYNAVTEHVTHSVSTRKGSTMDTHMDNLWFGRLNDTLDRAFQVSMDMMEEKGIKL